MTERQIAKELERQKVLFEEQVNTGQYIGGKVTFSEFVDQWFQDYAEKQLNAKTIHRYHSFMERINSAIGNIRLDRLHSHHLMAFYNTLAAPRARQDMTYRAKSHYRVIIYTLLYTGLRRGELCGLEWKDINFGNQTLKVNRTSGYIPGKGVFEDSTKNDSSIRSISIAGGATNILREYKIIQTSERLKLGSLWNNTDRIFTQWDGKPIHPDTVSRWFRGFVERHNLPTVSIHSLRHTHATLLIANHADIRTVSGRLGHARTSTTLNIYSHVIRSADEAAAETIDNI